MLTLFLSWDIQAGKEEDYQQFVADELLPALNRLGLAPQNALFKLAGDGPQVVSIVTVESEAVRDRIFQSASWRRLERRLSEFVSDIQCRPVISERHVQM